MRRALAHDSKCACALVLSALIGLSSPSIRLRHRLRRPLPPPKQSPGPTVHIFSSIPTTDKIRSTYTCLLIIMSSIVVDDSCRSPTSRLR
eukprot:794127-Pleurochrysis_carterae.AAC.2